MIYSEGGKAGTERIDYSRGSGGVALEIRFEVTLFPAFLASCFIFLGLAGARLNARVDPAMKGNATVS
jgi:hypothetical protein